MSPVTRRQLLLGTGTALLATAVTDASAAPAANSTTTIPPAPVARVEPVKDTYFGETLNDPYRWMENDKDPDWLPFLKGQNEHTRAVLGRIPGRDALLQRIQQLSGDTVATRDVQRAGGKLFFEQRPLGADNYKLFVREQGKVRTLVDPTSLGQLAGRRPRIARLVECLAGWIAARLRVVEGRQRGFRSARHAGRRRSRSARPDTRHGRSRPAMAGRRQRFFLQPTHRRRRLAGAISRQRRPVSPHRLRSRPATPSS